MTVENEINISVYDLSTVIASGYTNIAVYTCTTNSGTFTEVTSASTRPILLSDTEYYQYIHSGTAIEDNYYKFKYTHTSGSSSFITTGFFANTSDLTEDLRYQIEDINATIANRRYTIKELRRAVNQALRTLANTLYRKKFKADYNGIITPRTDSKDKGIILRQALITIMTSQLTRAADQNISFSDGRGKINNRTHEALLRTIKELKTDLKDAIKDMNRELLTVKRIIVSS